MGEILATWRTTLGLGPPNPEHHMRLVLVGRNPLRYALEREEADSAGARCWKEQSLGNDFASIALIRGVLQAGRLQDLLSQLGAFSAIVKARDQLQLAVKDLEAKLGVANAYGESSRVRLLELDAMWRATVDAKDKKIAELQKWDGSAVAELRVEIDRLKQDNEVLLSTIAALRKQKTARPKRRARRTR